VFNRKGLYAPKMELKKVSSWEKRDTGIQILWEKIKRKENDRSERERP